MEFPTNVGLSNFRNVLEWLHKAWASEPVRVSTSVVGTAYLLYTFSGVASFFWDFLRPSKLHKYRHSETGSWALVTGSTDGIGYGFADVLLEKGFNILLHGRNPEKLERKRADLLQKYPQRSIETVVADASKQDDSYLAVAEKVKGLPGKLTVLVNNVGGIPLKPLYQPHWEISHQDVDVILNVNIRFTTQVTRAVFPILKENGPGLILTCGSIAGYFGIPFISTYSGTKGYIHSFTKALKNDCIAEGVKDMEVMGILIGNVQTSGNDTETPFVTISSRACAEGALSRVGSGKTLVFASWRHVIPLAVLSLFPESVTQRSFATEMVKRRAEERKSE